MMLLLSLHTLNYSTRVKVYVGVDDNNNMAMPVPIDSILFD
jgi:hypothetical protein